MNNKGLSLLEIIVVIVVIGILASLLLPARHPPGGCGTVTHCANNLQELYALGKVYASQHQGQWPDTAKNGFWRALTESQPPLIPREEMEILLCPVKGEPEDGGCDYRMTKVPWKDLAPNDPVLADKPDNHGENYAINVVLKNGDVVQAEPGDPLRKRCAEILAP